VWLLWTIWLPQLASWLSKGVWKTVLSMFSLGHIKCTGNSSCTEVEPGGSVDKICERVDNSSNKANVEISLNLFCWSTADDSRFQHLCSWSVMDSQRNIWNLHLLQILLKCPDLVHFLSLDGSKDLNFFTYPPFLF
jgi:hypothetical protein